MAMQEVKYYRKGAIIYGVFRGETKLVDVEGEQNKQSRYFPHKHEGEVNFDEIVFRGITINEAKRKSRELQGKILGTGILKVIPHKHLLCNQQGFNPNLRNVKRKPKVRKFKARKGKRRAKLSAEE